MVRSSMLLSWAECLPPFIRWTVKVRWPHPLPWKFRMRDPFGQLPLTVLRTAPSWWLAACLLGKLGSFEIMPLTPETKLPKPGWDVPKPSVTTQQKTLCSYTISGLQRPKRSDVFGLDGMLCVRELCIVG